jgi:hypothetical protein
MVRLDGLESSLGPRGRPRQLQTSNVCCVPIVLTVVPVALFFVVLFLK